MNEEKIIKAENSEELLYVLSVKHLYSGIYLLEFSNGERRLFDTTLLVGEVFEPLKKAEIYENPSIEFGIVTWQNGQIDCSPDYMYEHSYEYNTKDIIRVA